MSNSLIAKFKITTANTTITLRNMYFASINWGDGTTTGNELTHTYTSIGEYECNIDGVTAMDGYAFYGCDSLTSVTIPDSITNIKEYTFRGCTSLTSVIIPDSVTAIGEYAFRSCIALKALVIPNSVTTIGSFAFSDCTALETIECLNSVHPPTISENTFPLTAIAYVPSNILEKYKINWNTAIPRLTILPIKHITLNSLREYHR